MNDTTDKAALDAEVKIYRERMAASDAEIKDAIMAWLKPRDSVADSVCITRALFEIAFDRHVEIHEANGFDLIEHYYRRALERHRGPLQ